MTKSVIVMLISLAAMIVSGVSLFRTRKYAAQTRENLKSVIANSVTALKPSYIMMRITVKARNGDTLMEREIAFRTGPEGDMISHMLPLPPNYIGQASTVKLERTK